jgi:hypothetical protein
MFPKFAPKPTILIITFSFQKFDTEAQTIPQNNLTEVELVPQDNYTTEDAKKTLNGINISNLTLKSEYIVGDQIYSDFLVKQNNDSLDNIENEYRDKRASFIYKLQTVSVGDKSQKRITEKEGQEALDRNNDSSKIVIKNIKAIVNDSEEQKLDHKVKKDPKIKDKKENKPKIKAENVVAKLGANVKNDIEKTLSPIQADAQATTYQAPNWVPKSSITYFYDTDDLGMYPINNWNTLPVLGGAVSYSQPSLASGNGRTFLLYRNVNNGITLRNTSSNIDDARPDQDLSGGKTTNASPSVEWYYGKVYVIIKDAANNIFWRSSLDSNANSWTGWNQIPAQLSDIEMKRHNNRLYLLDRGTNNRLYTSYQDGGNNVWTAWSLVGNQTTTSKPVLASYFGKLYGGFRGTDGKGYVNTNTDNWNDTNNKVVRGLTSDSFGMAGYNGRLCFIFRDNDQQLAQYCTTDANLANEKYAIGSNFNSSTLPTLGSDFHLIQASVTASGNIPLSNNNVAYRKLSAYSNVRGYLSDMKWSTENVFNSNQGYEQDIFLSNVAGNNFETYLSKADSGYSNCFPTTAWTTSSLPGAYLDTRLWKENDIICDSDNRAGEVTYTLGSATPELIKPNVVYVNNFETAKGIRNKPVFKVTASLGSKNIPPNCLFSLVAPVWCIFSAASCIMVPFDATITNTSTFPYFVKSNNPNVCYNS